MADLPPDALGEHLCPAARQRIQSRLHQVAQDLLVGHAVEIGEKRNLDSREALQVDSGPDALEASQQLGVIAERQVRMEAIDDVDFGQRLVRARAELVPGMLERKRVGPIVAGLRRANEQNRQLATQTFVASTRML